MVDLDMMYVALLRGINVGGNNKIDMQLLRQSFENAGMMQVQSYINTGNIIFTFQEEEMRSAKSQTPNAQAISAHGAARQTPNAQAISAHGAARQTLQTRLEKAITTDFALNIRVLLRSKPEMDTLMSALPDHWQNNKEMKSDVLFLWESIDNPSIVEQVQPREGVDEVIYTPGTLLWSVDRSKQTKSALIKLASSKLYKHMTIRNVNTTRAVYELMHGSEGA